MYIKIFLFLYQKMIIIDEFIRMDEQFLTRVTDIYDKYLEKQYNTEQQHKR